MPIITKDQLGQTIEKGVKDGIPYGKITGQPPSSEERAIQKMLEKREAIERAARLEAPTYGANPNEIAEQNASAEMKRTGLDRYYHPQSGAYFEAFNKIRDRYLQQELGKKAAIEAEGRAVVGNRLGAFDKILQNQKDIQKEKTESAGLEEWRKAQAKLLNMQAEGGGITPAQNQKEQASKKRDVLKYVDDAIKVYRKIAAEAEKNGRPIPPQITQGTAMAWDVKKKILSGELNPADVEYHDINNLPDRNNPATQIQPPIAENINLAPQEKPEENTSGAKYKSKTEALSAIKELSAADALNVMRANGITKDELREFLNPTKKQQTPRPVTGMPLSFS